MVPYNLTTLSSHQAAGPVLNANLAAERASKAHTEAKEWVTKIPENDRAQFAKSIEKIEESAKKAEEAKQRASELLDKLKGATDPKEIAKTSSELSAAAQEALQRAVEADTAAAEASKKAKELALKAHQASLTEPAPPPIDISGSEKRP